MISKSDETTVTIEQFSFENLLLKFKLARRLKVAKTTYQDFPGELDVERFHIYKDPEPFRTTTTVDSGVKLKTIIIADPTVSVLTPGHSFIALYSFFFDLFNYDDAARVVIWDGKQFIPVHNISQFNQSIGDSMPLFRSQLKTFKENEGLNNDDVIVLDNTNLQAIANYIFHGRSYHSRMNDYLNHDEEEDESSVQSETPVFPPLRMGPQVFTSDLFMSFAPDIQKNIITWHCENNHPLHFQVKGFAKSKIIDCIKTLRECPQIILYFDDLPLSDLQTWLKYLKGLAVEQVIGVHRSWQVDIKLLNGQATLIAEYIHSLTQLQYLHFILEDTVSPLIFDLTRHSKLNYVSIYSCSGSNSCGGLNCSCGGSGKIPSQEDANEFLSRLPPNLKYLHLPGWIYGYKNLKQLLNVTHPGLLELGVEPKLKYSNMTHYQSDRDIEITSSNRRTGMIDFEYCTVKLQKPSLKLFSEELLVFIESPLYPETGAYCPFRYLEIDRQEPAYSIQPYEDLNLNYYYNNLLEYVIDNPQTSLQALYEKRDSLFENGAEKNQYWQFRMSRGVSFCLPLFLMILNKIDRIDALLIEKEVSMADPSVYTLPPHIAEPDLPRPQIGYFKYYCSHFDRKDSKQFLHTLFSHIDVIRTASLPADYICSSDTVVNQISGLKTLEVDDWSTKELRNKFPQLIISSNLKQSHEDLNFAKSPSTGSKALSTTNDYNTLENPEQILSSLKIFRDKFGLVIPVNYNRMEIMTSFMPDAALDNLPVPEVSVLVNSNEVVRYYEEHYTGEIHYYLGKYDFGVQQNEWLILPTLSTDDQLLALEANMPVELRYQGRLGAYEIRALTPSNTPLIVNYIIYSTAIFPFGGKMLFDAGKIICAKDWHSQYEDYFDAFTSIQFTEDGIAGVNEFLTALPQEFTLEDKTKLVCAYFNTFSSGEPKLTGTLPHQIDQALFSGKLGACRHRSKLAFKLLLALGIGCNIVRSKGVHMFLDLVIENKLVSVDLGGFRAITNLVDLEDDLDSELDDQSLFDVEQLEELNHLQQRPTSAPETDEANPLLTTYPVCDFSSRAVYHTWLAEALHNKSRRRQVLLLVDSLDDINSLELETQSYIHSQSRKFASVDNFQRVKFFELEIKGSEQCHHNNELGDLIEHGGQGDVLLVPVHDYSAATINPLLDHRRQLKNKKIPLDVFIIAVMLRSKFEGMADDFISRFPNIYSVLRLPQTKAEDNMEVEQDDAMEVDSTTAEFIFGEPYLSFDAFAGQYALKETALEWTGGWLTSQLEQGATELILVNAPFHLPEFTRLITSIKKGSFYSNGALITIPASLKLSFKDAEYVYPDCFTAVSFSQSISIDWVLNALTYKSFFKGNYEVINGQLRQNTIFDGIDNNTQTLNLLVTDNFSDSEWYSLFTYAEHQGITLNLIPAEGVTLPGDPPQSIVPYESRRRLSTKIEWFESSNPHEAVNSFIENGEIPIYLTPRTAVSDLLGSIALGSSNSAKVSFKETAFTLALKKGNAIVLYGEPSTELRNAFETLLCSRPYLLINGKQESIKGSLRLCFTQNRNKSIIAVDSEHRTPYQGQPIEYNPLIVVEGTYINNLCLIMNSQRITLLTGLSPAEKPFWLHLVKSQHQFHYGRHQIAQWLVDGGVLILDYINKAALNELELVEQVYHAKQHIYFQGRLYPITPLHKMVLINSATIAREDPIFSIFKTGKIIALEHTAPSADSFFARTLWPAWTDLFPNCSSPDDQTCVDTMLKQYSLLRGMPLETIAGPALGVLSYLCNSSDIKLAALDLATLCDLALHILYPEGAKDNKAIRNMIQATAKRLLGHQLPATLLNELAPMQSVMALHLCIQLHLLHEAKKNPLLIPLMTKGLLFEGAPGIGKTYLSMEILKAQGYRQATIDDRNFGSQKAFILAPTDDLLRCKRIIACARERGYVVLLDELNTISLEEPAARERSLIAELIESLETENDQNHENFFVIANQNTATSYSNRITLPEELLSLFTVVNPGHFRKRDYRFFACAQKAQNPDECASFMKKAVKAYEKRPGAYTPPTIRTFLDFIRKNPKPDEITENKSAQNDEDMPNSKRRKIN